MPSPRQNDPTPTQMDALRRMAELRTPLYRRLVRVQGGFWTLPTMSLHATPEWSVGTRTVWAMELRGWIEPVTPGDRTPRRITVLGMEAASRGSSRGFSGADARKPKRANGFEPSTFSLGRCLPTDPGPENAGNVGDPAESEQGMVTESDRS